MARSTIWTLEVHFYPDAVAAGAKPVERWSYGDPETPGDYRRHEFTFTNPPSRADFLGMCRRHLPWTSTWDETLFKYIETKTGPWPMVAVGHKRADAPILDDNGTEVGRLVVSRNDLYDAEGYDRAGIFLTVEAEHEALKGYSGDRRAQLRLTLIHQENTIQERIAERIAQGDTTNRDTMATQEMRKRLAELGEINPKRKATT